MIAIYLLKSTLCLGILFGFYKLALEHKAMHQFKRFYLLASLIFALTIPLMTFTYTTTQIPEDVWVTDFAQAYEATDTYIPLTPEIEASTPILPTVLWSLYGLGVLLFGSRFVLNLFRLKRKIDDAETLPKQDFTLALLPQTIVPHSFFKWIFLSRKRYEKGEVAPEVLAHEATHVRQKHSLDILFIEFLQVLFWFNPLFWLSKKSIKLNHEFLADRGALENDSDVYHYQNILLSYASSTDHAALESPFNYSLTKKRILMLSTTMSRKRAIVSALMLVPVLTGCVLAFNNAIVAIPTTSSSHPIEGAWIDHANENRNVSIYERNDTLWWDQSAMKVPIQRNNNTYSITSAGEVWNLSITENDKLKLGSAYFTRPDDMVSYRIDGVWQAENSDINYTFITKNGTPTCDISALNGTSSKRYYPNRTENGMTFSVDNERLTFKIKNNTLIMQDGSVLMRTKNMSVYKSLESQENDYVANFVAGAERNGRKALVLEIKNNQISINGTTSSITTLQRDIDALTKDWEEQAYTEAVPSFLFKNNSASFLEMARAQFKMTHFSKANGGMELGTLPSATYIGERTTEKLEEPMVQNHLLKMKKLGGLFFEEEKEISFEKAIQLVKNNEKLNIQTPVPYSNPPKTYITKYPMLGGHEGAQIYEDEYKLDSKKGDTVIYSTGYDEKFLMVMDNEQIGRTIDKKPQDAGVNKEQLLRYNKLAKKYNAQPKASRVIPASDLKTLETIYRQMNTTQKVKNEAFPECDIQNPVTAKELKEYNRLATKYGDFSKGKIRQGEVARMYDIYSRMTTAQKKTAKAYPALPPPPPPPPPVSPKVKKGEKSDIPPPPPPPPAPPVKVVKGIKSSLPPPPPPPSPEEHFVKMRKLGGIFFYEKKEITFDQAVKLVNENDHLNIKTPYPYSKPPKTFITKTKVVPGKRTPKPKKDDRDPKEEEKKSPKFQGPLSTIKGTGYVFTKPLAFGQISDPSTTVTEVSIKHGSDRASYFKHTEVNISDPTSLSKFEHAIEVPVTFTFNGEKITKDKFVELRKDVTVRIKEVKKVGGAVYYHLYKD